jgi:hypothetical protein
MASDKKRVWAYALCLCLAVGLVGYGWAQAATATELNLRVTRTSARTLMFPLDITIRDSASVQRLYDAALALPGVPHGVYNCPADSGTSYRLEFLRGTLMAQQMEFDPDGCRFLIIGLEGPGSVTRQMSDAFLTLFMQTAQISSL